MTVEILTEKQRSDAVRRLRFCYLCGKPLGKDRTRDHVPPTSYVSGRAAALPMRAHQACNQAWSVRDERAGQLASTMIGRYPSSPEQTRIDVTKFTEPTTGETLFGVLDYGMANDVRRIVRAFHAALYDDYLPDEGIQVSLPFSAGRMTSAGPTVEPPPRWHAAAVLDLLRARADRQLDRVVCHGGECEYICTWLPDPQGCVFGLRLHVWGDLGEPAFGQRGCVGHYVRPTIPPDAGRAPTVAVRVRITNPMDPFAE